MSSPVKIRSSSIASIIDCPLRGLSIMLGLVKQLASTAPATIGSAVHEGTASFDHATVTGYPINPDDAAGVVVDYLKDHNDDTRWGKITPKEAERRALGVYTRYCTDISPKMKYEAVELPLTPMILDVNGVEIELTGTLDRVYKAEGTGILDIKTGVNACSQKPE
ncbi:PD-(D/E)XK nuclease family protein, partial [bacterium]|nr:PD-(D/E)XK nuclease family protein [bacterium]